MSERGIVVDHSMLHRWVICLVPLLEKAFRQNKRPQGIVGEWMKPTSGSEASGNICTAQWIQGK